MSEMWEQEQHPAQAEVHEPVTEFDGPISVEPGTELDHRATLLDPLSGELIPTSDLPKVAQALANLREYKGRVQDAIRAAEVILLEESEIQGAKTLRYGRVVVEVSGGSELLWDVEVLDELLDLGLPEERFAELVKTTVERKVDARVAKQIEASNEAYAGVIDRARSRVERPRRARVTHS